MFSVQCVVRVYNKFMVGPRVYVIKQFLRSTVVVVLVPLGTANLQQRQNGSGRIAQQSTVRPVIRHK